MNIDEFAKRAKQASAGKLDSRACHALADDAAAAIELANIEFRAAMAARASAIRGCEPQTVVDEADRLIAAAEARLERLSAVHAAAVTAESLAAAREAPAVARSAIKAIPNAIDRLEAAERELSAARIDLRALVDQLRGARSSAAAGGHEAPALNQAVFDRVRATLLHDIPEHHVSGTRRVLVGEDALTV
jgi:hypothetical protein